MEPTPLPDYEAANVGEDNLLVKLWRHPTATLRYILRYCPNKYVPTLLVLGGIVRSLDRAAQKHSGDHLSTTAALVAAVLSGGLFGWLTYYLYAWGMHVAGEWLGGRARTHTLKTVLAWALVPTIATLGLTAAELALVGGDLFRSTPAADYPPSISLSLLGLQVLEAGLAVWALVLLVKCVMLVQGFGVGRALANILLPGLLLLLLVVGVALVGGSLLAINA